MKIEENVSLQKHTTFRVGGPARFFATVRSLSELAQALKYAESRKLPIFILGEGSNILVSDKGFPGLVIRMATKDIDYKEVGEKVGEKKGKKDSGKVHVTAAAGLHWDDLVADTVRRGLYGIENLSGIPGTVGAAPVQNIGAYGGELKDTLLHLDILDPKTLKTSRLDSEECRFGYRDSFLKRPENFGKIVVAITLELKKGGPVNISYADLEKYFAEKKSEKPPDAAAVREAVLWIRKNKLPDVLEYGTVGSFFKNPIVSALKFAELSERFPGMKSYPAGNDGNASDATKVKISAAWLIDKVCGLKNFREGNVGTYITQPLAIVNYGGASAQEITNFARKIEDCVKEKTGISLEWEVGSVGFF